MPHARLSKFLVVYILAVALWMAAPTQALTITLPSGSSTGTINGAIKNVSSAGGGTVRLTAGQYKLTGSILMKSSVTLEGAGISNTIILGPANPYTWTMILSTGDGLYDITVQNMTIDGNCPQQASGSSNGYVNQAGLDAVSSSYGAIKGVTYDNLEVKNCSVGMHGANVNNYRIIDCSVHDCGMWVREALWQHNLYFNACENVLLTNSAFFNSWQGCGIHLDSTTGQGSTWTVSHCTASENSECGILIQNGINNVTVDHSTFTHNGYGANYARNLQGEDGINFGGGSGSLINENRFSSNRGFGLQVFSGSGSITENASYGNVLGQYAIYGSWRQIGNH